MSLFTPWWLSWPTATPQTLDQPILPGWFSLTVNENNSSAPDTERRIVAQESYGRQIGKLMDVVERLVTEAEKSNPSLAADPCIRDLAELKARIDAIKLEAQKARQDRLIEDLLALKQSDATQFTAIIQAVTLP